MSWAYGVWVLRGVGLRMREGMNSEPRFRVELWQEQEFEQEVRSAVSLIRSWLPFLREVEVYFDGPWLLVSHPVL